MTKSEQRERAAQNSALRAKWRDAYLDARAVARIRGEIGPLDLLHFAEHMEAGGTTANYRFSDAFKAALDATYSKADDLSDAFTFALAATNKQ